MISRELNRYLAWGVVFVTTILVMSVFSVTTIYFSQQTLATVKQENAHLVTNVAQIDQQIADLQQVQQSQKPPTTLGEKVAFLTFDDGPSERTEEILQILATYNVPATFYVTGYMIEKYPQAMETLVAAGHGIAAHSYSHQYRDIYASLEAFISDFTQANALIKQYTGTDVTLFRHPGGSSATAGTPGVVNQTLYWLQAQGIQYTDWNVDSMDALNQEVSSQFIVEQTLLQTANCKQYAVILLHDSTTKQATVEALPAIIEGLQLQGYEFAIIPDDFAIAQHRTTQ